MRCSGLRLLPHTLKDAAKLGRRHDHNLKANAYTNVDVDLPLRHAIEIRHESFRDPAFVALLRNYQIALVAADTVEWPLLFDETAEG